MSNTTATPIVEIKDVWREYTTPDGGTFTAIKDVNLVITDVTGKGEMRAVLGPSGCGKSTMLNMIAGLDKPTRGTVKVDGKIVEGPGPDRGMVFQSYSSMPWLTVLDNVAYGLKLRGMGREEREALAMTFIKRVGLEVHAHKYPTDLSGGQKQRVAIARTLACSPRIIIMDEPFGALDVQIRLEMQNMMLAISEDLQPTILFVTHDIDEAVYLSDRVYVFSSGPGTIIHELPIELGHPRTPEVKQSARFRKYELELLDVLHQQSKPATTA
jgi:NitT/TauT family transport system ATP-binding protein